MADHHHAEPHLSRRRAMFRMATATAAATAIYIAPVVVRIDEAEAKGSKRRHGSKRYRGPSRRHHGSRRRRPSRRW